MDAKAIDSRNTIDWIRERFKKNVARTLQVGGAKNSYVAPRAFHEYQAALFYITDKQFPVQDYQFGLSMIDGLSEFAPALSLKSEESNTYHASNC